MCLEKYLVEQCAPTLASLKTGSLFGVIEDDAGELTRQVAEWQAQLAPKGLILTILRYRRGRALIYMGRLSQLKRDLACPGAEELLRSCGYEHENTEGILRQLRRRVCTCESFPHEIGLFLGYPLTDVLGFIQDGGKTASVGLLAGVRRRAGRPAALQKLPQVQRGLHPALEPGQERAAAYSGGMRIHSIRTPYSSLSRKEVQQ